MPSPTEISVSQLARLVGQANAPTIVDVRTDGDYAEDPRLIPGSLRRNAQDAATWAHDFAGSNVVVICQRGMKLSQGAAAWLRHEGIAAETLAGGFEGWQASALPLVNTSKLPPRDGAGRTVWVTRARPKIDRIACPWLIRRFVDPKAVFLFVAPSEVMAVAGSGPIEAAHVSRLLITERVIKESMRLYPPAPVLVRMPLTDTMFGDVNVRAGAQIVVPIYAIHRHRKLWSDPDRFNPDRFLPDAEKAMPRTQYMPFGAGPRICIGMKFAYMEAVAILATLVRALKFLPNPAHQVEPNIRITLRPEGGMPLHVEKR